MTDENHPPDFEAVWQALSEGDVAALEVMASQSGFPQGVDDFVGRHWLTNAIHTARLRSVGWVLSKGIDPNYTDDEGACPLKSALQMEQETLVLRSVGIETPAEAADLTINLIDLLLNAGADINYRMTLDETALHVAAMWSSPRVVEHFLAQGADPFAWDAEYTPRQPIYYAKFYKRWDVHDILYTAMATVGGDGSD